MFKQYWISLQFIGRDTLLVFRNFIHWNLSKIVISLATLITAIVLSIPFVGLLWWIASGIVNSLGWSGIEDLFVSGVLPDTALASLTSNLWLIVGIILVLSVIFTIFTCMMSYGYYLTAKVCESYTKGEKLDILKNDYFNPKLIWKFIGVLGWSGVYLLAPLAFGLGVVVILFVLFQAGILTPTTNLLHGQILGGLLMVGGICFFIYFVIVTIRVLFSYMFMLDGDVLTTPARQLVQKSIALVSGKIAQIILLILPFIIVTGLVGAGIEGILQFRDIQSLETRINAAAKADPKAFENDHSYVQREFIKSYSLDESSLKEVLAIANEYNPKTDGVDREYLKEIYPYIVKSGTLDTNEDMAWRIGISILGFLLLEGVIIMVYLSVFHILRAGNPKKKISALKTVDEEVIVESDTEIEVLDTKKETPKKTKSTPKKVATKTVKKEVPTTKKKTVTKK